MYTALGIARYFLHLDAQAKYRTVSNKKLQKLLYYAQVWHYTHFGQKLFRENMEAWIHGPVVPSVYSYYRGSEWAPIVSSNLDYPQLSRNQKLLLDEVWAEYGKHDADYLEALTHVEAPWLEARAGRAGSRTRRAAAPRRGRAGPC